MGRRTRLSRRRCSTPTTQSFCACWSCQGTRRPPPPLRRPPPRQPPPPPPRLPEQSCRSCPWLRRRRAPSEPWASSLQQPSLRLRRRLRTRRPRPRGRARETPPRSPPPPASRRRRRRLRRRRRASHHLRRRLSLDLKSWRWRATDSCGGIRTRLRSNLARQTQRATQPLRPLPFACPLQVVLVFMAARESVLRNTGY